MDYLGAIFCQAGVGASLLLTNIFVFQLMAEPNSLRLVLDGFTVDDSRLENLRDTSVDGVALNSTHTISKPASGFFLVFHSAYKVFHGRFVGP